jgi:signal peptidase II
MKSRLALFAYLIAVLVVILDQASKAFVLNHLHLAPGYPISILSFFNLNLTSNTGVSYGLFRDGTSVTRWLLSAFSAGVAVALIFWVRNVTKPLTAVGVGLIIGGAIGNLIDRVRLGAVVDFLDFSGLHFPWIFNAADSAITVGVIVFLIELVLTPDKKPAGPNRDDHAL